MILHANSDAMRKKRSWATFASLAFCAMLLFPLTAFGNPTVDNTDIQNKVFGQSDCQNNQVISFSWTFDTTSLTLDPTFTTRYKIILGSSDETAGILLKEGTLTANPTQPGANQNTFGGDTESGREKPNKGMIDDNKLTMKDLIGYQYFSENQKLLDPTKLCELQAPSSSSGEKTVDVFVWLEYKQLAQAGGPSTPTQANAKRTIKFDLTPPLAPDVPTIESLENSLKISWKLQTGFTYDVYYKKGSAFTSETDATKGVANFSGSQTTIANLENGQTYHVAIRAYDPAGNKGAFSKTVTGVPQDRTDFYEAYRKAGGTDAGFDGGGYCFIATAAYGTYDHKYVKVLRDFRDKFLLTNGPGSAFVAWYYKNSPAWANWLKKSPNAKFAAKVVLLPTIAFAAFFVRIPFLIQFLLMGAFLLFIGYRLRKRFQKAAKVAPLAMLLLVGALALPNQAHAQVEDEHVISPRNFGFEFRMGPYSPDLDLSSDLSSTAKPYEKFFGSGSQFYMEASFEWLFFKKFGTLGLSASVGLTWNTAEAKVATQPLTITQTDTENTETTATTSSFWVVPTRLDLVYRFDYFAQKYRFPFVPYVRGGLDYFIWFVTAPDGSISTFTDSKNVTTSALGGRFGFHTGLGLQFLLDVIDPTAARTFDVESGVNHTYLFIEWNFSWVGTVTPGLNLSDHSLRAGLMFQF